MGGAKYCGRRPIFRALSVVFSKHEFRTSTQNDEDPPKCSVTPGHGPNADFHDDAAGYMTVKRKSF